MRIPAENRQCSSRRRQKIRPSDRTAGASARRRRPERLFDDHRTVRSDFNTGNQRTASTRKRSDRDPIAVGDIDAEAGVAATRILAQPNPTFAVDPVVAAPSVGTAPIAPNRISD